MRSTYAIVLATLLSFALTTTVSAQKGQGQGPKVKTTSAPKAQSGGGGSKAQGGPKATTSSTTTARAHGGPKAKPTTASGGSKKTTTTTSTVTAKNSKKSGGSTSVASTSTTSTTSSTTTTTSNGGTTTTLTPVQQKLQKNTKLAQKLEGRLPPNTDVMLAAEGFRNLGQFVAAVNVSNNLGLTFTELKARMVDDGMSLGQAIKAERGDLADTTTQVARAETEANQMIASTQTTTTSTSTTTTNTSTTTTSTSPTKKTKKSGGQ